MPDFSPLQKEILNDFFKLQRFVHRDTSISLDLLKPKVQPANEGLIETDEFFFWLKTLIRSFLGELDAIGFALRHSVVRSAPKLSVAIPNRDLAKLSERRYDRERDEVTAETGHFLPTLESLKLGLRFFPKLFGSQWTPDFTSSGWQALTKLTAARHAFTHPGRLEKLMPRDAYVFVEPAVSWYAAAMSRLLIECSHEADPNLFKERDHADPDSVEAPKPPKEVEILDEEFYEQVHGELGHLVGYATEMFKLLSADTGRAINLLTTLPAYRGKTTKEVERSDEYQFAMRNILRTLFSQVEGTIGYIEFVLSSSEAQRILHASEAEVAAAREGEVEDRLLAMMNLWSLKLGTGELLESAGDGWDAFQLARKWRDRITHPTQVMDFMLLPSVMKKIMEGARWFLLDAPRVLEIREIQFPAE